MFVLALLFLSSTICVGTVLYYAWGLSLPAQIAALSAAAAIAAFAARKQRRPNGERARTRLHNARIPFFALLIDLIILTLLWRARTMESARSPWEAAFPIVFLLYALSTALFVRTTVTPKLLITNYQLPTILHFFTTFAVSAIIFPLGYGFDQILHQAAEKVIAAEGVILPKTPYYIGQYSMVTILSTILPFSIETIDRFLVPTLAAIFLPWLLSRNPGASVRHPELIEGSQPTTNYHLPFTIYHLLFIIFALPFLTLTTPLNLALLWLLFTVLVACTAQQEAKLPAPVALGSLASPSALFSRSSTDKPQLAFNGLPWLLAVTTLLIHPMVGIPALVFLVLWYLDQKGQLSRSRAIAIAAIGALILPAILYNLGAQFSLTQITNYPAMAGPRLGGGHLPFTNPLFHRFDTIRDFVYSFNALRIAALLLLAVFAFKKRINADRPFWFATSSALFSSLILFTLTSFPNVAGYENLNFSTRLLTIAYLILLPTLLRPLKSIIKKLPVTSYQLPVTLVLLLTASWYLLYHRVDDGYVVARGYATSIHDIEAVHWIDQDAGTTPYIVLSTQSVAAAAIREFGFRTYYPARHPDTLTRHPELVEGSRQSSLFFYSIPTGGPLYQSYLKFVYDSSTADTVRDAMTLAGVPRAYVVLNRYWFNAPEIAAAASRTASTVKIISADQVGTRGGASDQQPKLWIFRYDRRNQSSAILRFARLPAFGGNRRMTSLKILRYLF